MAKFRRLWSHLYPSTIFDLISFNHSSMSGTCKSTGRWRGGGDEGTYVSTVWLDVGIKIAQFLQSLAKILPQLGQWRGSVGRAVASHSRGQVRIQSSVKIYNERFIINCIVKKKRPELAHFFKKRSHCSFYLKIARSPTSPKSWQIFRLL